MKDSVSKAKQNAELEELKAKYRLDKKRLDEIFYQEILPEMLYGAVSCEKPKMVFTTGQQASGKSVLTCIAEQAFAGYLHRLTGREEHRWKPAIAFSRDDLRMYDPNRAEIFETRKAEYSALTAYNASYWRDKLIEEAVKRKINIVFEAVLKDDRFDEVKNAIMIAKRAGYPIYSWSLAVNENVSLYSMFNRYENQIEMCGEGDIPPHPKNHDAAYQQFPKLVDRMIKEGVFDKVIVRDRAGIEYYDSSDNPKISYLEAVEKGRRAFYDTPNWKQVLDGQWKRLIRKMQCRHASDAEMFQAKKIMSRCLSPKKQTGNAGVTRKSAILKSVSKRRNSGMGM